MGLVKNAHISGWVYVLRSVASDLLHESLSAGPYSNDSLRLSTRQRRDVIYSVTALASSSSPTSDVVIISLLGDNLINFHPFCQIYGHCKDDDGDVINPFLGWWWWFTFYIRRRPAAAPSNGHPHILTAPQRTLSTSCCILQGEEG